MHTGKRRPWLIALACYLGFLLFFSGWYFVEERFFGDVDPETLRHTSLFRGVLGSFLTVFTATWLIVRHRSRVALEARQQGEYLDSVLTHAADAIISLDAKGMIKTWNEAAQEIFGYGHESIVGRPRDMLFPEDQRESEKRMIDTVLETDGVLRDHETEVIRNDGQPVLVSLTANLLRDRYGEVLGQVYMLRDVTRLKQAEMALRDSEARTSAIIDTAVDGIITIDERGRIQLFNPSAEHMFGYRAEEVLGKGVEMLMPEPYRSDHGGFLSEYLQTGNQKIIGIGREVTGQRKDGSTFPMDLAVSEVSLGDRRIFAGICRDLTEVRALQSRVVEKESLARVGELASAVAHEIKNPLTGISEAIRFIQSDTALNDESRDVIEEILYRLKRLDGTVNELLVFARPKEPEKKEVPIALLIERILTILQNEPELKPIEVRSDIPEEARVFCDSDMLERVLMNMILNAAQAIDGEGSVDLELTTTESQDVIAIRDTGKGIPEDEVDLIFQPFYTTKHRGTGLGLSICKRFVEDHGGAISVSSRPGNGTTFSIALPRDDRLRDIPPPEEASRSKTVDSDEPELA